MRPKSDFKHLMLTLALSVMLAVFGFMAMSGAWFFDTEQDTATITLKNGIQLQTTGLTETDGVYTLNFNNSTELAPGQTITAENVTVKVKYGVNSSDIFLRYKLTYQYKTASDADWVTATPENCYLTSYPTQNTEDGFHSSNGWYYCLNSSAKNFENLKTISTNYAVTLFDSTDFIIATEIPEAYQIQVVLSLDAVQNTVKAAKALWGENALVSTAYLNVLNSTSTKVTELSFSSSFDSAMAEYNTTVASSEQLTNYNTCGWFLDEELTQVASSENISDGTALYTKKATLDPTQLAFDTSSVASKIIYVYAGTAPAGDIVVPAACEGFEGCLLIIDRMGFRQKVNIQSFTLSSKVVEISASAFLGCTLLSKINFPNSLQTLGDSAFNNCTGLTSVKLPDSITSMGSSFYYCSSLTTVNIPKSLSAIPARAFYGCSLSNGVIIPDNITAIGDYAFYTTDLLTIDIPSQITSIGYQAFHGSSLLKSINFLDTENWYSADDSAGTNAVEIDVSNSTSNATRLTYTAGTWNSKYLVKLDPAA